MSSAVVGLPGDTIEIRSDGHLYINGVLQEEPLYPGAVHPIGIRLPIPCPRAAILSWGDNRNNSLDSRSPEVGSIPKRTSSAMRFSSSTLGQMEK